MRLGTNDVNEIQVRFNLDSCAGMNTGNKLIHQYIVTHFPQIVKSYEEYNGSNPFSPILLEGVTTSGDNTDFEKLVNSLPLLPIIHVTLFMENP